MSKELSGKTEKAPARALYKAWGLSDDEIAQPIIAVLVAAGNDLTAITDAVKNGIIANGGTPVEMPAFGLCAALTAGHDGMRYVLPSRELIADAVESALIGQAFDGAVLIADEPQTACGMLMGAARVNLPTVLIGGGYSPRGVYKDRKAGFTDLCVSLGRIKSGSMSLDELSELENLACPASGCGLYAGNDFACTCEALGMTLIGNGTIPAQSAERIRLAKETGKAVMGLVKNDVRPRMILTKDTFNNAIALSMAIGAPADVAIHLIALAAECGIELTLQTVQQISDRTPTLCLLTPLSDYDMEDFAKAGGVAAVLNLLASKGLIKGDCLTVTNKPLSRSYQRKEAVGSVIASLDNPLSPHGSLAVLRGNLCDDGAIVRRQGIKGVLSFSGKAQVFESMEDCLLAVTGGKIHKGDALVVRYEGPKGGPGMRDMSYLAAVLEGMGLLDDVVIITDGRFAGLAGGFTVGYVSPEAAESGKIALVKNGDKINIDINAGKMNLDIPAKEIQVRTKKFRPKDDEPAGLLLRYKYLVTSADKGCVFKKKF